MTIAVVLRIAILLTNIAIGALVYRRNPRSATHIFLSLLTVAIFFWGVANEFSVSATTPEATLLWARLVMMFAVPVSMFFFLFMYTFPRITFPFSRRLLVLMLVLSAVAMATATSPYLFTRVQSGVGDSAELVPGPGMPVFIAIAVFPIFLGLFSLLKKNRAFEGVRKIQARYLLLGTVIMYALIFGLILTPVITSTDTSFVVFAPVFTLPFVALTAYTIVRHRLMDIRVAVARSLSFSLLVGVFLAFYGVMLAFAVPVVSDLFEIPTGVVAAIAAFIAVILAQYTQQYLRRVTDKIFFQQQTDFHAAMVRISQRLSRTIEIEEVTTVVMQALRRFLRSKKIIIYLQESSGEEYVPQAAEGIQLNHVSIPETNALIARLKKTGSIIVQDELKRQVEEEAKAHRQEELDKVSQSLEWMDAQVAVPLFIEKGLTGFILLSEKLSGQPYSREDLELLGSLAPQAATALENARLYKESLEFAERLKMEVHRATAELEVANRQLKDLDKAKSEFLSIASHQLYTPLTAIRGYLSMLKEGDYGKISDKQQPVVEIIEKSADRLIELIKNLLDISRIESGRLELQLESIDLAAMAKELVQDIMPNAMKKDLQLIFHEPREEVSPVVVDRQRIRQVLLNFIDNAIKYTERGHIDVSVNQAGQQVVFSVTDTGKGLAQDEIARLFTKFTRVGGASRFHTEGTGLGLYVARQIVREHHGEVQVTSPGPGQGSTFTMRVPAQGSPQSLKLSDKASVVIKAAEAVKQH